MAKNTKQFTNSKLTDCYGTKAIIGTVGDISGSNFQAAVNEDPNNPYVVTDNTGVLTIIGDGVSISSATFNSSTDGSLTVKNTNSTDQKTITRP